MEQRKRRQYTLAERQAVIRDIDEHGVLGAAKKHGVPQSCVSRWASAARTARASKREAAPPAAAAAQAELAKVRSETTRDATRDATMVASLGTKRLPVTAAGVMGEKVRTRAAKLYTPSQKAVSFRQTCVR